MGHRGIRVLSCPSGRTRQGPLTCAFAGQGPHRSGGRYWVRTSDLFRVREARYRCANRPKLSICTEVATGFEPVYTALQAAASPLGHATLRPFVPTGGGASERMTGLEPATLTLAR